MYMYICKDRRKERKQRRNGGRKGKEGRKGNAEKLKRTHSGMLETTCAVLEK